MQHYEEVLTSASDLLDSQDSTGKPKCHQSRELPRIPPDSTVDTLVSARSVDGDQGVGAEGPYEVLKDSPSQENMVEDCLYETVTEIKEVAAAAAAGKGPSSRARAASALKELPAPQAEGKTDFAEYASVDRNKKCRQSVNADSVLGPSRDPEEDAPPPVPVKLLDENENLRQEEDGKAGEEGAPEGTRETSKVSCAGARREPRESWGCSWRLVGGLSTHVRAGWGVALLFPPSASERLNARAYKTVLSWHLNTCPFMSSWGRVLCSSF